MTQPHRNIRRADLSSRRITPHPYKKRRLSAMGWLLGSIVCVCLILACALILLSPATSQEETPPASTVVNMMQQPETPAPELPQTVYTPQDSEADIVITGDIMCLAGQLSAAKVSGGWDFTYAFENIAPILQGADFAIGNLEVPVAGKEKGVTAYNQVGNPILNAPLEFADAVQEAGFDMVVTANNHAFDMGDFGLENTIKVLDERNIYHSGTYVSQYMQQNTPIVQINGISVAFLSYTQFVNTGTEAYKNSGELYKMNLLDPVQIEKDIAAAKARNAEWIVLYVHWGTENTNTPNAYQLETAQQLADIGADVIIGSHSHTVQPAQYLTSKDGREVFVIYSMGNLISSMPRDINQDTLLLNLHISRTAGKTQLTDASYMCVTGGSADGKSFAALPSRLTIERGSQTSRMNASINRINAILGDTLREETCFSYAK